MRTLATPLTDLFETVTLIGGGALVSYGAWEVYAPAGPITAGTLLIAGTLLRARGAV